MIVNNSVEKANDFETPAGNRFEVIYSPKVQADGSIELVETGKKDIQEEIDSWYEHTDMSYILRAMAATGEIPNVSRGFYGDFSEMPGNMAEAMQLMLDAEAAFYELPLDRRNAFDNDFKKWLVLMHTDGDRFAELMQFSTDKVPDGAITSESEVKE